MKGTRCLRGPGWLSFLNLPKKTMQEVVAVDVRRRIEGLEKKYAPPGPAPAVIIEPGDPVPAEAQVVFIDDIPKGKIADEHTATY